MHLFGALALSPVHLYATFTYIRTHRAQCEAVQMHETTTRT